MPKIRKGKTQRDRLSGATARRLSNRSERAAWSNISTGSRTSANFPRHTCNGKRNRSVIITKKNGRRSKHGA